MFCWTRHHHIYPSASKTEDDRTSSPKSCWEWDLLLKREMYSEKTQCSSLNNIWEAALRAAGSDWVHESCLLCKILCKSWVVIALVCEPDKQVRWEIFLFSFMCTQRSSPEKDQSHFSFVKYSDLWLRALDLFNSKVNPRTEEFIKKKKIVIHLKSSTLSLIDNLEMSLGCSCSKPYWIFM